MESQRSLSLSIELTKGGSDGAVTVTGAGAGAVGAVRVSNFGEWEALDGRLSASVRGLQSWETTEGLDSAGSRGGTETAAAMESRSR